MKARAMRQPRRQADLNLGITLLDGATTTNLTPDTSVPGLHM